VTLCAGGILTAHASYGPGFESYKMPEATWLTEADTAGASGRNLLATPACTIKITGTGEQLAGSCMSWCLSRLSTCLPSPPVLRVAAGVQAQCKRLRRVAAAPAAGKKFGVKAASIKCTGGTVTLCESSSAPPKLWFLPHVLCGALRTGTSLDQHPATKC